MARSLRPLAVDGSGPKRSLSISATLKTPGRWRLRVGVFKRRAGLEGIIPSEARNLKNILTAEIRLATVALENEPVKRTI